MTSRLFKSGYVKLSMLKEEVCGLRLRLANQMAMEAHRSRTPE
jgi:hypothetical protein